MSVFVLGREELAVAGAGLLSLRQLAVVGVGLFSGWADPFEVAEALSSLHRATVASFRAAYEGRHGDPEPTPPLDVMREIGCLLGIRDEPIEGSIRGRFEWEFYDKEAVHERAWRYMRDPEAAKQARNAAWSLVYNALDNGGRCHMTDAEREIAMYVCQALLVVGD